MVYGPSTNDAILLPKLLSTTTLQPIFAGSAHCATLVALSGSDPFASDIPPSIRKEFPSSPDKVFAPTLASIMKLFLALVALSLAPASASAQQKGDRLLGRLTNYEHGIGGKVYLRDEKTIFIKVLAVRTTYILFIYFGFLKGNNCGCGKCGKIKACPPVKASNSSQ